MTSALEDLMRRLAAAAGDVAECAGCTCADGQLAVDVSMTGAVTARHLATCPLWPIERAADDVGAWQAWLN